jgi:hypothetical protein
MKRTPKFISKEYLWEDVKPGMRVHGVGGIVVVKSVEETLDGILITPEGGNLPWTQHPSNTVTVAFENPAY